MTDYVRSDISNGVLTLTLNRPEKKNASALAARMKVEGVHFAAQLKTADAREAFEAFAGKRGPKQSPS